jgi:hypothetical protein
MVNPPDAMLKGAGGVGVDDREGRAKRDTGTQQTDCEEGQTSRAHAEEAVSDPILRLSLVLMRAENVV